VAFQNAQAQARSHVSKAMPISEIKNLTRFTAQISPNYDQVAARIANSNTIKIKDSK